MVKDALDGKIDLILTKSVSRFARNTVDSLSTIRKLKDKGVEVYFEKENINTLDSKGELLISIMSSLSQEESRSISENTKWGKRRLMSEGKVSLAYSTFLGYEKGEDGKLKINKEEAKTVKLIYNLFLKGLSYYQIKKELEKKNLKTPFGNLRWHQSTVKSILTNEKYKGDALLQKGYTVDFLTKKQKKNEGEVQQYYIEGDHEGIVTKAMFDAVKTEIAERGDRITKYAGTNIITAKLVCGDCGGTLRRKLYHSNDKYRGFRYRCVNRCEGTKECHMRIVRDEDVKEAFVKEVNNVVKNKKKVIDELRKMIDMIDVRSEREKLEEIKDKIKKINIEIERLNKEASEGRVKSGENGEVKSEIATGGRNTGGDTSTIGKGSSTSGEASQGGDIATSGNTGGVDNYKTRYDALETAYYNYKKEAEDIEYKIQDMDLRKMKLETTLRAYKHSKIINEFDADIWNGLLDKCIVLKNGYEFVWRK